MTTKTTDKSVVKSIELSSSTSSAGSNGSRCEASSAEFFLNLAKQGLKREIS